MAVAFNAMVLVVRVLTMDLLRIGWLDRVVYIDSVGSLS